MFFPKDEKGKRKKRERKRKQNSKGRKAGESVNNDTSRKIWMNMLYLD